MPENSISRRSLTKSAAWSVPVVAVAVAAPMAAASTTAVDIVVSRSCATVGILGTLPRFTISAAGGTIPAGTTLTLTGAALASVTLAPSNATVSVISSTARLITIGADVPSATIAFTGILGLFAVTNFSLSLTSVPTGYTESPTTNNSASVQLTGLGSQALGYTGLCNVI